MSAGAIGAAITSGQFAQLMEAIQASQNRIAEKLAQFQDEVGLGQEEAVAKALKRIHIESPYTYRRKGNEEQAGFNRKVEDTIKEAQLLKSHLHSTEPRKPSKEVCNLSPKGRS